MMNFYTFISDKWLEFARS